MAGPVDRQRLLAQSNSPLATKLQGRLLLIHGALDDNVSPAQSLRLAEALMKADKQVDMLIVPNADHAAFYEPQVQQHIWQYFDDNLKRPMQNDADIISDPCMAHTGLQAVQTNFATTSK